MENQRFLLYGSLALVLFLIWSAWQRTNYAPLEVAQPQVENTAEQSAQWENDLPEVQDAKVDLDAATPVTTPTLSPQSKKVNVSTDVFDLVIDTRGADIQRVELKDYSLTSQNPDIPFVLLETQEKTYVSQSGLIHDRIAGVDANARAPNHHNTYQAEDTNYVLKDGQEKIEIPFTWQSDDGLLVTKTFVFTRGSYLIEVNFEIQNNSKQPWVGRQYKQIRHSYVSSDHSLFRLPTYTGAAYYDSKYNKLSFDNMHKEPLNKEVTGGWVAMLQHHFFSAWLAAELESNLYYSKIIEKNVGNDYIIGVRSDSVQVNPQDSTVLKNRFYAGPKLQKEIEDIQPGLELTTDYGIFTPLSKPLFWLLNFINTFVHNWGWSIILLTLLIKLAFYRLSASSYKSMAKMRKIQPKFQAIRERYGDDKQKLNQAMMEMYRKEKINPIGGCLPILIQMPVFISLYWVLIDSVELRQAPFMLWIQDLSTKDPFYILPLLMGISMFVQFKLNPKPPDPMQEKIFMIMPILMSAFMAFFPAGLVLYWLANNLLSIAQQWYITRKFETA